MDEVYPVLRVEPEWVLHPEEMGSKEKFWYRPPAGQSDWLFKYPQTLTGQHWAEKLAEQAAAMLGIHHARVEFAEFQGTRGSATESFTVGGWQLLHGNQILGAVDETYDRDLRFGQSRHTLARIFQAMDAVFGPATEKAEQAKACIAEFLVLDALVGNTDRHHENWGLVFWPTDAERYPSVAPTFDHASSLGRELRDELRATYLKEGRVGWYVERGRGGVYWSEEEPRGPSPLELVRQASRSYPELFRPALGRLEHIECEEFGRLVGRVPEGWMTHPAQEFATALVSYSHLQLKELE